MQSILFASETDAPPAIVFWENVPGVLSTKDNAFGCFLGALAGEDCELKPPGKRWADAGCVFGPQRAIAWRVLDAQYFGLAQRRRRVFVVASAREGFDPAAVLFEFEGVRRDTPPRREAGQGAAGFTPSSIGGHREGVGTLRANGGDLGGGSEVLVSQPYQVANCLTQRMHKGINSTLDEGQTPVLAFHHNAQIDQMNFSEHTSAPLTCSQQSAVCQYGDVAGSLTARHDSSPCADRGQNVGAIGLIGDETPKFGNDVMPTLRAEQGGEGRCVATALQVRRLLPEECETLQGFPQGYTCIPWRGKSAEQCPDGPRYKALGNSWAVPVVRWIGERINAAVEQIKHERKAV
jgi:DNA (cytosine-5)-methyltransferase 1